MQDGLHSLRMYVTKTWSRLEVAQAVVQTKGGGRGEGAERFKWKLDGSATGMGPVLVEIQYVNIRTD